MRSLAILVFCVVLLVALALTTPAWTKPKHRCAKTDAACLARAVAWQKAERRRLEQRVRLRFHRDTHYAIRLASRAFGVNEWDMRRVAMCESRFNPFAQNRTSSAAGLFQFLDGTWRSTPFATFSVYDPVANALAAAQIVHSQGWRQWECG